MADPVFRYNTHEPGAQISVTGKTQIVNTRIINGGFGYQPLITPPGDRLTLLQHEGYRGQPRLGEFVVVQTGVLASEPIDLDIVIKVVRFEIHSRLNEPVTYKAVGASLTMDPALWTLLQYWLTGSGGGVRARRLIRDLKDELVLAMEANQVPVTRKVDVTDQDLAYLRRKTGRNIQRVQPTNTTKVEPRPIQMLEAMASALVTAIATDGPTEANVRKLLDLREDIALARNAWDRLDGYMEGAEALLLDHLDQR